MNLRRHSRLKDPPELDITAFMNLMVVLVPFLLITVTFARITMIDLQMPQTGVADAVAPTQQLPTVTVKASALELADDQSAFHVSIEAADSATRLEKLGQALVKYKTAWPERTEILILPAPDVDYETLIQVMDTVRMSPATDAPAIPLFPDISLGEAPGP